MSQKMAISFSKEGRRFRLIIHEHPESWMFRSRGPLRIGDLWTISALRFETHQDEGIYKIFESYNHAPRVMLWGLFLAHREDQLNQAIYGVMSDGITRHASAVAAMRRAITALVNATRHYGHEFELWEEYKYG